VQRIERNREAEMIGLSLPATSIAQRASPE